MNSILSCSDIHKTYQEGKLQTNVLYGVNLDVKQQETLAILGSSGSGKSTLLHILGGLDLPSSGEVYLNQQHVNQLSADARGDLRNRYLGFVYQFHHLLPEFTAVENVAMPLLIAGQSVRQAKQQAKAFLNHVDLADRYQHKPPELSGGERQRVAVARALVTEPLCVLADEPTGNLDQHNAKNLWQLMHELNHSLGTSFVVVTHDDRLAQTMQRTIHLQDGQINHPE